MKETWLKVNLYILSLALLFVFLIIITALKPQTSSKLVAWGSLFLLVYSGVAYAVFHYKLEGAHDIPFEITKIESINYEHLTFLATYVIPLISFDFNNPRQLIVLNLLLITMGCIYIKTDLFYANPSLALLGYQIYRADGNFKNGDKNGIVLICREGLKTGQKVRYIKLDESVYYVRRMPA